MFDKVLTALLIGLLVVGGIAFLAGTAHATDPPKDELKNVTPTEISVSGDASVEVDPDLLILQVGVETHAQSAQDSAQQNAAVMEKVKDALRKAGINESDIKTAYYTVSPEYSWDERGTYRNLTGYGTTHMLSIRTPNVGDAGKIIDAAVSAGANNVNSIEFTLSDAKMEDVKSGLLNDAVLSARHDADAIANAMGHKVDAVKSVSSGSQYVPYYRYYSNELYAGAAMSSTDLSSGQVKVQMSVSAVYLSLPVE